MPGNEDQVVWTFEQAKEAVKMFLATLESDGFAAVFADPSVDPSDLAAFRNDDSRRQDGQSAVAQTWWTSVRQVVNDQAARFLTLAEPLAQHGVGLDELYAAVPREYHAEALRQAFTNCCSRHPQGGPPPGITNTKGWGDERIREKLEEVKARLDWANTTGNARKWWEAFEKENTHRWALVLRLAEELAVRKATISEFFLAYVYSNTDNIQANLCYLDFTRLKKEEERKKKAIAAERAAVAPGEGSPPSTGVPLFAKPERLPPGITDVKGWSDERILAKFTEVRSRLDWDNTSGSARQWWEGLENKNKAADVLWLAEELANRRATITEFFLAYVYSNTDNLQANLHYMNYTRLKKEEERKKKEAAQRAKEPAERVKAEMDKEEKEKAQEKEKAEASPASRTVEGADGPGGGPGGR